MRLASAALVFGLLLGYVATHFRVTTDISHFLPAASDRELSALSRQIADSELSRTMVLSVEGPDRAATLRTSHAFEAALRRDARVAGALSFLEGGPRPGLEEALFGLYEPRRLFFYATSVEGARERLTEAGLRQAARALREELAGPLSPLASRVAPRDPFLSLPTMIRRLEKSRAGELGVADGRFITADGRSAILFLGTEASALDARAQAPVLEGIRAAFDAALSDVAASERAEYRLDQSGVNRFATRAAAAIEADIKRVSLVSTLLLCGLLLLLFRSLRFLALAAVPVAAGVVAGCAAVLFLFGRVHGITLAFGAALIGVSIDYVVHLYCHHCIVSPGRDPEESLRAILRPLLTGAITTGVGFAALAASALSGLREVACFAVAGISVAFAATLTVLPVLMRREVDEVPARTKLVAGVRKTFVRLEKWRRLLWLVPLFVVGVSVLALPKARWNPDLASLGRMDPELVAEDERVRAKVARFEQMRFVVALGADEDEALQTNDRVARRLDRAIAAGELAGQRSVAPLLPSATQQRTVAQILRSDPGLPERLRRVFAEEGFAPGVFAPFLASLSEPLPEPLSYDALLASPAGPLVRAFRVRLGDRVGFLTYLNGVTDAAAIEARLADLPGAIFVRQADLFSSAQLEYQRSTAKLLAWGLLAVLVLLALRYRDPRRTLAAFLPAVLAACLTVATLSATGRGLDLISLTALLFVVSMGVDYSVFLVDAQAEPDAKGVAAALTGALLACVSTVGAFSLLALSEHPVLADLGLTAAVGIGSSLLLAPLTLVLLRPPGERPAAIERDLHDA